MKNEAKLPKTQAATLATMRKIKANGEEPVAGGVQREGIYHNALGPLRAKGFIELITTSEGFTRYQAI